MPIDDGWDLAQKIKENNYIPNAKKVVLSNQGEKEDKDKSKEFGVDGYIVKALNTPSEVVKKIQELTK